MGGSNTSKIVQLGATAGGFALGGPAGAAAALAATRAAQGKDIIGSDLTPKIPQPPEIPEAPVADAAKDLALRNAIIERIRKKTLIGPGRKATIGTSAQGVTDIASVNVRKLRGL